MSAGWSNAPVAGRQLLVVVLMHRFFCDVSDCLVRTFAEHMALLRWGISGRAELHWRVSDRPGEFGERRGDPQCGAGVDSEFVVAAAQILYEGMAGDHDLGCPISL
jgi:hypothetical protein